MIHMFGERKRHYLSVLDPCVCLQLQFYYPNVLTLQAKFIASSVPTVETLLRLHIGIRNQFTRVANGRLRSRALPSRIHTQV